MRLSRSLPAAAAALLFTAACESFDAPVGPQDPALSRAPETPAAAQTGNSDRELARVARSEIPGFAGFYLQDDGTAVIRLVDPRQRGAAARYVASQLAGARGARNAGGAASRPVFLDAAHDFAQLVAWSEALHPLLSRPDVYLIDVDEVENGLLVGVADQAAIGVVRAAGAQIGIPAGALEVRTQEAPRARASVRDWSSDLRGGIQIAFGGGLCTYGFNAVRSGVQIFVTNSHCTPTYLGYDGGTLYQNTTSGGAVGTEYNDRGLYACYGTGTSCRRSDAAYIRHTSSRTRSQGRIARTSWATGGPGGLTITGEFDVVARYSGSTPVGTYLDKTGRTSGSTYGQVTNSCVTIGNFRCQDISKVWSEPGDSGSPIHVWQSGSNTHLQGILWGGPGSDYTTTYSSRLAGIEYDLGALSGLCRPGYGC